MDRVTVRWVWRGLVLAIIALALILGGLAGSGKAHADVDAYLDENDKTYVTYQFIQAVLDMNNAYPEVGNVEVDVAVIPIIGVFAGTVDHTITFEETYAEMPYAFEIDVNRNIRDNYFPGGCTPARLVAIHEFGHVLDNTRGRRARMVVQQLYGSGIQLQGMLTGYSFNDNGTLAIGEALANAFAAVQCGTANALERNLFQILTTS
jgi:hypothetical protein